MAIIDLYTNLDVSNDSNIDYTERGTVLPVIPSQKPHDMMSPEQREQMEQGKVDKSITHRKSLLEVLSQAAQIFIPGI